MSNPKKGGARLMKSEHKRRELAPLAAGYLRAMLFGLPGMMLFVNVRGFLEGYARTRPAMLVGPLERAAQRKA